MKSFEINEGMKLFSIDLFVGKDILKCPKLAIQVQWHLGILGSRSVEVGNNLVSQHSPDKI